MEIRLGDFVVVVEEFLRLGHGIRVVCLRSELVSVLDDVLASG